MKLRVAFSTGTPSRLWQAAALVAGCLAVATPVVAQRRTPPAPKPPDNELCLGCHSDASLVNAAGKTVTVVPEKFAGSIHGTMGFACVECHADLKTAQDFPHALTLAKVDCGRCHEAALGAYNTSIHADARRKTSGSVAATCADCHTTHEIRSSKDPASSTYPLNLPATCSRCHGDPAVIKQGHIAIGNVAAAYKDSIHGRAVTRSGLLVAATCESCHGSHDIRQKSDTASKVNRANIPATCGTCHEGILTQYAASIHGQAFGKGNPKAPVCADCHTAHGIQRADVSSWQLDVIRECGTCHVNRIETYRDTFHGQVTSLGFMRVATCAACHGAHDILPAANPQSRTSPARVLSTCQQCHPSATSGFAAYDPHADKSDRGRNPVLYVAASFMKWLLVGVFGFFGLHAALWFPRSLAERRRHRARAGHGPTPPAGGPER